MITFDEIKLAFNKARLEKDKVKKTALEAIIVSLVNKSKSGENSEITENDIISAIEKYLKILQDEMNMYIYNNIEKYEMAEQQSKFLFQYLPNQLTEDEVIGIIKDIIFEINGGEVREIKNKGLIMKPLMTKYQVNLVKISSMV